MTTFIASPSTGPVDLSAAANPLLDRISKTDLAVHALAVLLPHIPRTTEATLLTHDRTNPLSIVVTFLSTRAATGTENFMSWAFFDIRILLLGMDSV